MLINATNFLHHPSTRNLIPQSIYIKFPPHTTFGYLLLNISFQSSLDAVIGDCAGLISMRLELLPVSVWLTVFFVFIADRALKLPRVNLPSPSEPVAGLSCLRGDCKWAGLDGFEGGFLGPVWLAEKEPSVDDDAEEIVDNWRLCELNPYWVWDCLEGTLLLLLILCFEKATNLHNHRYYHYRDHLDI